MTAPVRILERVSSLGMAFFMLLGLAVSPAVAADRSLVVIHAVVLGIDPSQDLVALHHEALETGTATDRVCRLRHHSDLHLLTRGTVIEATAETSHQPWILDDVHVRARTLLIKPAAAI